MADSKARDIIRDAYDNIGIPNPTANQYAKGLRKFDGLVGQWSAKSLLVPANTTEEFTLTPSQASYTFGTGGDFNSARPVKIDYAVIKDSNNQNHPVSIIEERDYFMTWDKTILNRPCELYLDTTYPLSTVFLWPTPNAAETLHISSQKPLSSIATLDTDVALPGAYVLALEHELTRLLAPGFGWVPDANFLDMAKESKSVIVSLRASRIPDKVYDDALTIGSRERHRYDIRRG